MHINNAKHSIEVAQHSDPNISKPVGKYWIFELTRVVNESVKSVVNDSTLYKNVYNNLIERTKQLRLNKTIDICFLSVNTDEGATSTTNKSTDLQEPLPAFTKTANASTVQKRLLSQRRKITHGNRKQYIPYNQKNTELLHIPRGRNNTKSCALCKGTGHNRTNCVRLIQHYGKYPIPLTGITQRKK